MFFERMIQLLIKEKEQFLHMTWREKLRIEITHYDFNTEFYFEIKSLCLQRKQSMISSY